MARSFGIQSAPTRGLLRVPLGLRHATDAGGEGEGERSLGRHPRDQAEDRTTPGNAKLLLVEDDDADQDCFRQVLAPAGYRLTVFSRGQAALDWLRDGHQPDLILLDFVLAGMTSWEFLDAWRDDPRYLPIPVLVTSGFIDPRSAAQFLGVEASLPKPFSSAVLLATVAECLKITRETEPRADTES